MCYTGRVMHRVLLVGLLLLSTPALAQNTESFREYRTSQTPAWLPRSATFGLGIAATTTLTAEGRLQWEITLAQQRVDALIVYGAVGGGIGLSLPSRVGFNGRFQALDSLNRATAQIGVGYRGDRGDWNWGFQAGAGPMLYDAKYRPDPDLGTLFGDEQHVMGWVEGRAQFGYRFSPVLAGGLAVSFGSGLKRPRAAYAYDYLSGWTVGIYIDWR